MSQTKKQQLKEILRVMKGEAIDFSAFDSAVKELRKSLEEKVAIPTLDRVNSEIENFREKIDLAPLQATLEEIKKAVNAKIAELYSTLETKLKEQRDTLVDSDQTLDRNFTNQLSAEINSLRVQIAGLDTVGSKDLAKVEEEIKKLDKENKKLIEEIKIPPDREEEIKKVSKELDATRIDLINRINQKGGGNMNRNIAVGGNTSVLSRYTDLNIKPGTNVTLTYSNNNTSKYLDLTIAATGGGGGTSRSISTVAVSSVVADTAATDIVVLASAGIQLTLPTAVANTNLYTIKNIGSSSIFIGTTGGQTIDTAANIIMPIQFTSVDLISDNTNWNIT